MRLRYRGTFQSGSAANSNPEKTKLFPGVSAGLAFAINLESKTSVELIPITHVALIPRRAVLPSEVVAAARTSLAILINQEN